MTFTSLPVNTPHGTSRFTPLHCTAFHFTSLHFTSRKYPSRYAPIYPPFTALPFTSLHFTTLLANFQWDRPCTYILMLWLVRVTIVSVEKQQCIVFVLMLRVTVNNMKCWLLDTKLFGESMSPAAIKHILWSSRPVPNIIVRFQSDSYSTTNKMHLLSQIIYSCKTLYMFRSVFPSIIRSSNRVYSNGICQTAAATCCSR